MLYILTLRIGDRVGIRGIFESATPACHAAINTAEGFGNMEWACEELERDEIVCMAHGNKVIRVMGVEPNKLWPLAYYP
jgi:hypothetical protein